MDIPRLGWTLGLAFCHSSLGGSSAGEHCQPICVLRAGTLLSQGACLLLVQTARVGSSHGRAREAGEEAALGSSQAAWGLARVCPRCLSLARQGYFAGRIGEYQDTTAGSVVC